MTFDANGVLTAPTAAVAFDPFTPPDSGEAQVVAIDHGSLTTQQSGPFTVATITQDGFATGELEGAFPGGRASSARCPPPLPTATR